MVKHALSFFCFLALAACSQNTDAPTPTHTEDAPTYNAALAQELGADEYGMRNYVFATLLTGPNDANITDEEERNALFRGHFAMINRLAEEGKLVLAGPFMEARPKRGLYIFNVETIAEAEALIETDPSIKAGVFEVELSKYYGSAALVELNDIHATIQKAKVE